jgi:radical SAM superfamily enzyme YgiQ (UPF0313 family)
VDNDFVGSSSSDIAHTVKLLKEIIKSGLMIEGAAFVTIEVANNDDVLELMFEAGIRVLMIGFESIDEESLKRYGKGMSPEEIQGNMERLKKKGFTILGSFMAGSDDEDDNTVLQTANRAMELGIDQLYYFVLWSYPEMNGMIPSERVFIDNWNYATGHHVTFFPKNTTPSKLQKAILQATSNFYSLKRIMKRLLALDFKSARGLMIRRILFKKIERAIKDKYVPRLEEVEEDFYDNGELNEHLLKARPPEKLKWWKDASERIYIS